MVKVPLQGNFKGKELYLDGYLKSNLDLLVKDVHDDGDCVLLVTGREGCLDKNTKLFGHSKTLGELYQSGNRNIKTYSLTQHRLTKNKKRVSPHPIISKSKIIKSGKKEAYEITLEAGEIVLATSKHTFFKVINNKTIETQTTNLKEGDFLRVYPKEKIRHHYNRSAKYQERKRVENWKAKRNCKRCGVIFYEPEKLRAFKKNCNACRNLPRRNKRRENAFFEWELQILRNFYHSWPKEKLMGLLPNRTWISIQHKALRLRLRRDEKFMIEARIGNQFTAKDNPAKLSTVRTKKALQMKEYYRKHPKRHPNHILKRNHKTQLEKIMQDILIKQFKLTENKDFFYNQYFKVEGTYKFPDFNIPDKKLIIECDCSFWHKDKLKDKQRDTLFNQRGYKVIHFSEKDLLKHETEVIECLRKELLV